MQNIDVRFNATSNFSKVKADLAALEAQAAALGNVLQSRAYAKPPAVVNPQDWRVATQAVHRASRVYRDAASSSGLLTTQQIRATSEAERFTKALQKQKLSLADMRKHSGIMKQVYQDQLRYQRMTAQYWGTDMAGRAITDISIPKNVPRDLDTAAQRLHFLGQRAKSAGTQIINLGKNMQWAGRQLTVGFTYPMALFGAAAGMMAYKVEDAFGKINKVYDYTSEALSNQNKLEQEQSALRIQSMEMATQIAKRYGLQVQKTLEVEQALAATGLKGAELMSATAEVQRISALGDIDPTQTTDMVVALQTAFKMDPTQLTQNLNFMNAASNATSLSLQDIAESVPRAASGLAQLDVTAEEMTIMLVSMREAGVDAAEGANALKSATTRILNPVKKATEFYKQYGISIQDISEKSGGNLYDFLGLLGKEQQKIQGTTEEQTKRMRAQGIAALFGTYQFNRLNAALVNLSDAQAGENNQTRKAIELQKMSVAELEHMAQVSEEAMTSTPAAKFRKAWATFQIQLAEMGGPFLEAATKILEAGTKVGEFFNGLDSKVKKLAMAIGVIMGLAGPLVMVTGLAMNLFGQFYSGFGKAAAAVGRLGGAVGLVNKEERAATLTAEAQNKAMQTQQATMSTLAQEVQVLTAAYAAASAEARAFAQAQGLVTATASSGLIGPQTQKVGKYQLTSQEQTYYSGTSRQDAAGKFISNETRLAQARNKMAFDYMRANNQVARDATKTEKALAAQARATAAVKNNLNGAAIAGGVMAVSMAAMMLPLGETATNIAKWAMISSLVVPALKGAVVWSNAMLASSWKNVAATGANVAGMGALASATAVAKGAAIGFGRALNLALGPVGWILLGITAIGAGIMFWKNKQDEIARKQREIYENQKTQQELLTSGVKRWADSVSKVGEGYGQILRNTIAIKNAQLSTFRESVNYYRKPTEEGGGAGEVAAYTALSGQERNMRDVEMFAALQAEAGLTAKQAAVQMSAFFVATGKSALEADSRVRQLLNSVGEFKDFNKINFLKNELDLFAQSDPGELEGRAQNLANAITSALSDGATIKQANEAMNLLAAQSSEAFNEAWARGIDVTEAGKKYATRSDAETMLASLGVTNPEQLAEYFATHTVDDMTKALKDKGFSELQIEHLGKAIETTVAGQKALMSAISKSPLDLGTINSISDLWDNIAIKAKTLTYREQVRDAQTLVSQLTSMGVLATETQKQNALDTINEYNRVNHLKTAETLTEALHNLMYGVKVETKGAADEAKRLANNLPTRFDINLTAEQVGGVVRDAMSAVQEDMADSAMDSFNNRWDSTMESVQNSQEAAQDALDRRQQAAQDAFDARWDARKEAIEKAYQARIDAVQREIDAEQRADQIRQNLYEKEKARLQRLAEMENTNIDFNTALTEGRLDDAAKTLNNAGVQSMNDQMEAEQDAAEARSEARVKALEKKTERLEKQRDKELKQLEKMEERMRKHLERIQDARANALQRQQEQQMDSLQRQRDFEEAMLEQRLELFKSYTARNQKDLERWMREVGLSYDDFGSDVKAKGEQWSTYFQKSLSDHIRQAGLEVMNDGIWENVGKAIANKLVKGLGFDNLAQFQNFVRTGTKTGTKKTETRPGGRTPDEVQHNGGIVGTGGSGRGNIPNTFKGLHRSERMVLAQKGEYIVNRKSSAQHKNLLAAINNGTDVTGIMGGSADGGGGINPLGSPGYGAVAGIMSGIAAGMFARGVNKAFGNVRSAARRSSGTVSGYVAGAGGRHRPIVGPITSGLHGTETGYPAIDMAGPTGRPVYAVASGTVSRSYDIPGPLASDSYRGDGPYGSYGRVVYLKTDAGPEVLYAHLSRRSVNAGQKVKGGSVLGYSGNTGNSSGPHLHFGATNGPYAWLRRGGTIRHDNTPVIAHRGETMLSSSLTQQFKDNVRGGGSDTLHVTLDLRGAMIKEDVDIEKAINKAIDTRESKLGRKRIVR